MEYIAINSNPYFEHHGRLGQKWGKKNGPPYPLDYSKLSQEERNKDKERVMKEGDVQSATYNKNSSYFTTAELNEIANRYQVNERLNSLNQKKIDEGKQSVDDMIRVMGKVVDVGNKISNGIQTGSNIYNNVAKVANTLGDANLPIIGETKKVSKTSFLEGDLEKMLKNVDKYSDQEIADMKKRADNIDQLRKKTFRGNDT